MNEDVCTGRDVVSSNEAGLRVRTKFDLGTQVSDWQWVGEDPVSTILFGVVRRYRLD